MKKKLKKILMNPWTIAIGSGIIVAAITAIIAKDDNINFGDAFKLVLSSVWKILNFPIPLFAILIIIALFILVMYMLGKRQDSNAVDFLNYTEDNFDQWHFKWSYSKNSYTKKYDFEDFRPVCQCGCDLSHRDHDLICPRCKSKYPMITSQNIDAARKVIYYNIDNEKYKH